MPVLFMRSLIQTAGHKMAAFTVVFSRYKTSVLKKLDQKSNEAPGIRSGMLLHFSYRFKSSHMCKIMHDINCVHNPLSLSTPTPSLCLSVCLSVCLFLSAYRCLNLQILFCPSCGKIAEAVFGSSTAGAIAGREGPSSEAPASGLGDR